MPPDPDCTPPPDMQRRALMNANAPYLTVQMLEYVYKLRHSKRFRAQSAQNRRSIPDLDVYGRYLYGSDLGQVNRRWHEPPPKNLLRLLPPTNPYWKPPPKQKPPKNANHNLYCGKPKPPDQKTKTSQNK